MKSNHSRQTKKGFTLIEMIVVMAVMVLVLPSMFGMIFAMLRQQVKIQTISTVKNQGDFALSSMTSVIKNRTSFISSSDQEADIVCTDTGGSASDPYFFDQHNAWFRYYVDANNRLISDSASLATSTPLTGQGINITDFEIRCNRNARFSPPIVTVSFTASMGDPNRSEEFVEMNYQNRIKIRNY